MHKGGTAVDDRIQDEPPIPPDRRRERDQQPREYPFRGQITSIRPAPKPPLSRHFTRFGRGSFFRAQNILVK